MKLINVEAVYGKFAPNVRYTGNEIMALLIQQPAAYDVDSVVEALESRSKEYNSKIRLHGRPEDMLTDDAVYIVRAGVRN